MGVIDATELARPAASKRVRVRLPLPVGAGYDYRVPDGMAVAPGDWVLVHAAAGGAGAGTFLAHPSASTAIGGVVLLAGVELVRGLTDPKVVSAWALSLRVARDQDPVPAGELLVKLTQQPGEQ